MMFKAFSSCSMENRLQQFQYYNSRKTSLGTTNVVQGRIVKVSTRKIEEGRGRLRYS